MAGVVGVSYALKRKLERDADEAANKDAQRMEQEKLQNRERAAEAKTVRAEALKSVQRGRNKEKAQRDGFDLASETYDERFADELRRLSDRLFSAQATSLALQPLFSALPLVGRPEDPRWAELFVLIIWTAARPTGARFFELHGDLLLSHLTRGLGGSVTRVSDFSHGHIIQWLNELCRLRPSGLETTSRYVGDTRDTMPLELEEAVYRMCTSGEPRLWTVSVVSESFESWMREDLGIYLRKAATVFLDNAGSCLLRQDHVR